MEILEYRKSIISLRRKQEIKEIEFALNRAIENE